MEQSKVCKSSNVSLESEFTHVLDWSMKNKLKLNTSKSKEIVFCFRLSRHIAAPPLPAVEQVTCAKVLGVLILFIHHSPHNSSTNTL